MNIKEKYINYGYKNLNSREFLELLLYLSGYKDIEKKSDTLIKYYGSIDKILQDKDNISKKLNDKFIILASLINEYSKEYIHSKVKNCEYSLKSSNLVVEFLRRNLAYNKIERFDILFLTNGNQYITYKNISKGTLDKTYVFIRNILIQVLSCNAKNVIIAHNHPSGMLEPSFEDKKITQKIYNALELFDIILLDHIIVSREGYFSFAERGLI
ncbi:JAB domain-containing protein [Oceanivirga salmonicida]|uniref:JAB domain-containing protein n=1 Tax=Oceanivirga salmonicida TaxID=1769291 RepID=UPI0008322BB0|nr:DNA repair protein RadC [Oceanivirga salmonicida]